MSKDEYQQPKLLRGIPDDIHRHIVEQLEKARQEHPSYRDDQLLVYLWAETLKLNWKP